jgi:hypothetical protein
VQRKQGWPTKCSSSGSRGEIRSLSKAVRTAEFLLVRYEHLSRSTVVAAASPVECGQVCSCFCLIIALALLEVMRSQVIMLPTRSTNDGIIRSGIATYARHEVAVFVPTSVYYEGDSKLMRHKELLRNVVYSESCHVHHRNCRVSCKSQIFAGDLLYQVMWVDLDE